jgi:hypothetical protein
MKSGYYYTKDGEDDWTVHGQRHHLQVVRTEGPSGRTDRRGEDILRKVFFVKDRSNLIDTSDQWEAEDAHGFTRLKTAVQYAFDKLGEYDERVDPRKGHKTLGRRSYVEMVHLAVQGPRNITTIGVAGELSDETLEAFAGMVRDRRPGKRYYIVTDTMPKQILYRWHVGEGFSHEEGWWIQ